MPATILRPYFLAFRNRYRKATPDSKANSRDLLLLVVTLLIMGCIFFGFKIILSSLQDDMLFREIIPTKLLELLLFSFFVLQLISSTIAAIGNIYNAQHMNLLLAAPISNARLFLAKLLETLFETSLMFVLFGLPVALAYMYTIDLKPGFLTAAAVITIPFTVIPAGLGIALATCFVRATSALWKRGMFLVFALLAVLAWGVYSFIKLLEQIQLERGGGNAVVDMIGLFDNPNPLWLPSRWAADLLSYYVTGSVQSPLLLYGMLFGTALGALGLGYLVFDLLMINVRSVAAAQERSDELLLNSSQNSKDMIRLGLERIYQFVPCDQQIRAIILKDLTSLVRDRGQSLQLLMYLGIATAYLVIIKFMSAALNLAPIALQVWESVLATINILFAGFIVTALMTRLVYPSLSLEGKVFWLIIAAPIPLRKLVFAKFWCWAPLIIFVASMLLMTGVYIINPTPAVIAITLFIGFCMSIGCTGLATGIGSVFASFEWESPNQISAGFGTLVLLLTSLTLVVVNCAPAWVLVFLTMVPAGRTWIGLVAGPMWTPFAYTTAMLLLLTLNIGVARYACSKGAESLRIKTASS